MPVIEELPPVPPTQSVAKKNRFRNLTSPKEDIINNGMTEVKNGKSSEQSLALIAQTANNALATLSENPQRYDEIKNNPNSANTKEEQIALLASREYILLIDKSGSMSSRDENPKDPANKQSWTLWNSAQVATEGILELIFQFDRDGSIDTVLFPPTDGNYSTISCSNFTDVQNLFQQNTPRNTTPLAKALEYLKQSKLDALMLEDAPFTVIIMTDGAPDNKEAVFNFFVNFIKTHRLYEPGRQYLAAFSFVQMGDDSSAEQFLQELDDDMERRLAGQKIPKVDIIDTKKDNFIFGTGDYKRQPWVGPLALLHGALFD